MTDHLAVAQDPTQTLQRFTFDELAQYTREQSFSPRESMEYRTFYVGRDDVHDVLKHLLSRCSRSLKMNAFGYNDPELDAIIQHLIADQGVYVQGTLDKSQAGGVHERAILAAWTPAMRASFAIGQSATHDISHTKGGVIDGLVAFEGSTNWGASGEGERIAGQRYHAQNNTLIIHTNSVEISKFAIELDEEHAVALAQQAAA